jgi:hypothetical protein
VRSDALLNVATFFLFFMEEEIWKDVIGYEGIYQVSNLGMVKSFSRGKEKILKGVNSLGYLEVTFYKLSLVKRKKVHQLVAETFIDKDYKSKGLVVNHINFKREDNRLENLEVVTQRQNSNFKHISSSSQYTGVTWFKQCKKWQSCIFINGKSKHLGYFDNEKEASDYYEAALICVNEGSIEDIIIKKRVTSSKYKGVCFDKKANKWRSQIKYKGKQIQIGRFKTEEQAYQSYLDYKIKNKIEF